MDLKKINQAIRLGLSPLRAPEPLTLSQWADKNFYLSSESSYVQQRWTSHPPQVAILDCIGNDAIREVNVVKSARVGYTKIILAAMGYFAQHRRRNQCVWQPTDEGAEEFCKIELETMLRDVKVMHAVFPEFLAKGKGNTLRQKKMLGCVMHIRGGKAATNYRRLSLDVAFLDELDAFDADIEYEGDPVTLSGKRIEGATFPKHVCGSTPLLKGTSLIAARVASSEIRLRYHIPCPGCGHEHYLRWGKREDAFGMKWVGRDSESIRQLCPACGMLYGQHDYLKVWARGRWLAEDGTWIKEGEFYLADGKKRAPPRSVAFHIWTAYSPHVPWANMAHDYFAAIDKAKAGDQSGIKAFTNTTLGEEYEAPSDRTDEHVLKGRAEPYRLRFAPLGVLSLVAGVDVQDDRWEVCVWGYGRGCESWLVDYNIIEGDPADERDWQRLDDYLIEKVPHAAGGALGIDAVAVDTGGHFTHQVYNYCRLRTRRRVFAIKGDHRTGQKIKGKGTPQDVNFRGRVLKHGVRLYMVGTDTAKDLLFGRLGLQKPGPGYIHFSDELPDEFYHGLTAEQRVVKRTARGFEHAWVPIRPRNEPLDCTVYSMFCASAIGLDTATEARWLRMEEAIKGAVKIDDRVEAVQTQPAALVNQGPPRQGTVARPNRAGGWVRGYRP